MSDNENKLGNMGSPENPLEHKDSEELGPIYDTGDVGNFLDAQEYRKTRDEYNSKVSRIIVDLQYHFSDLTDDEKNDYYTQLQQNKPLIRKTFNQSLMCFSVLTGVVRLTEVRDYDAEVDDLETGQNRFMRFGLDLILEMKDDINKAMREGHLDDWMGLRAFNTLITTGTKRDQQNGLAALVENIDLIEQGLNHEKAWQTYNGLIREIIKQGSLEQAEVVGQALERGVALADNKKLPSLVSSFFATVEAQPASAELIYSGWKAVRSILEKLGLPDDVFVGAWLISTRTEKIEQAVYDNLKVLTELEEAKPGTSMFLYKEFGIVDFGRYPTGMLLRQVEEFDDTSKPYGVIMYPRKDHNGAFYDDQTAFAKFFKSLNNEFSIRVMECEGKRDVAKNLIRLNRKYNPLDGSGHKISLAIIGGHGTVNTIEFGGEDDRHVLRTEDLMGRGTAKASEFFEENPTIILVSCSTGADKGIGHELSEKLGAKVIAPKIPTNISAIHASKNRGQGKFRFNATFQDKEAKNMYVAGK